MIVYALKTAKVLELRFPGLLVKHPENPGKEARDPTTITGGLKGAVLESARQSRFVVLEVASENQ